MHNSTKRFANQEQFFKKTKKNKKKFTPTQECTKQRFVAVIRRIVAGWAFWADVAKKWVAAKKKRFFLGGVVLRRCNFALSLLFCWDVQLS